MMENYKMVSMPQIQIDVCRHFVDSGNFMIKVQVSKMIDDNVPGIKELVVKWSSKYHTWKQLIDDCHKIHCQSPTSPLGNLAHAINYNRGSFYQYARLFNSVCKWTEPSFKYSTEDETPIYTEYDLAEKNIR